MSLIPLLVRDVLEDLNRPTLFDQNFGLSILNEDLSPHSHCITPLLAGYYRPWRHMATRDSGVSNVKIDKDTYKVNLDVQQFKPEEISVKTVDDFVVIEGKHEERQDEHGYISRQFQRRYKLPKDIKPETVTSSLSSDGVLSISAPLPKVEKTVGSNERVVPITHTKTPAVKAKSGPSGDEKMEQ